MRSSRTATCTANSRATKRRTAPIWPTAGAAEAHETSQPAASPPAHRSPRWATTERWCRADQASVPQAWLRCPLALMATSETAPLCSSAQRRSACSLSKQRCGRCRYTLTPAPRAKAATSTPHATSRPEAEHANPSAAAAKATGRIGSAVSPREPRASTRATVRSRRASAKALWWAQRDAIMVVRRSLACRRVACVRGVGGSFGGIGGRRGEGRGVAGEGRPERQLGGERARGGGQKRLSRLGPSNRSQIGGIHHREPQLGLGPAHGVHAWTGLGWAGTWRRGGVTTVAQWLNVQHCMSACNVTRKSCMIIGHCDRGSTS